MLTDKIQNDTISRLKKIEGQIRGLQRMIEDKKYCIDILFQFSAVSGALNKVSQAILKNHIETCVAETIASSAQEDKDKKIKELVDIFDRFMYCK